MTFFFFFTSTFKHSLSFYLSLNSHTISFASCFYTAFSVISRRLFIFSLHSTAKIVELKKWNASLEWLRWLIHLLWPPFLKPKYIFFPEPKFMPFLCKRKDVKGVEKPQPTGPRSRYEPYWTYQVQDGRVDHMESVTQWGEGSLPSSGLHQEEAAIPQSKTADRLNAKGLDLTLCGLFFFSLCFFFFLIF